MRTAVFPKVGAKVVGPYSPAVRSGSLLFLSGQIGKDPITNELGQNIDEQVQLVFTNIKGILNAENLTLEDVLKVTVYLSDMNHYQVMNDIYSKMFSDPYPARTTVEVSKLPAGALIEMDVVAQCKEV